MSDADDLLSWRNESASRAASQHVGEVGRKAHLAWLSGILSSADRALYIGTDSGGSVGMCRFDVEGESAEVSINLNPAFRGLGLAQSILVQSIDRFTQERGDVRTLTATIRPSNTASDRIFTESGFRLASQDGSFGYYVR